MGVKERTVWEREKREEICFGSMGHTTRGFYRRQRSSWSVIGYTNETAKAANYQVEAPSLPGNYIITAQQEVVLRLEHFEVQN
jgi:hypothetical protein